MRKRDVLPTSAATASSVGRCDTWRSTQRTQTPGSGSQERDSRFASRRALRALFAFSSRSLSISASSSSLLSSPPGKPPRHRLGHGRFASAGRPVDRDSHFASTCHRWPNSSPIHDLGVDALDAVDALSSCATPM